ncbi:hypothetical protein [Mycolicibacterium sp.]|uniref:hypothetical protein n=1 Tax=Mycolicibacterium sp. TaxID=2320850 RepID=UPI00355EED3A
MSDPAIDAAQRHADTLPFGWNSVLRPDNLIAADPHAYFAARLDGVLMTANDEAAQVVKEAAVVTIECSRPGDPYTLFKSGTEFDVHLAGPSKYGTGPILCGFDRFQRDENGRWIVGFSVGGGCTGPGYRHHPCSRCAELAHGRAVRGTHRNLFGGQP